MRPINIVNLSFEEALREAQDCHVPQSVPDKLSVNVYSRGPLCNADCGFCGWNRNFSPQDNEDRVTLTPQSLRPHFEYSQQHGAVMELMDASIRLTPRSRRKYEELLSVAPAGINPGLCEDGQVFRDLHIMGALYYVNNLETPRNLFSTMVSSHRHRDKIRSLRTASREGVPIHTGFVIGLGETAEDIAEMIGYVNQLRPGALNLNFFYPIRGLPISNWLPRLPHEEAMRRFCLFRIAFPDTPIYLGAGRREWLGPLLQEGERLADGLYTRKFLNHEFLQTVEQS